MKIFELRCRVYLKRDISFGDSFDAISKFISFSLTREPLTKDLHHKRGYKYYSFGSFFPIERDKVYKRDKIYNFIVRTIDSNTAKAMSDSFRKNINNPSFQVLKIDTKVIKEFFISELYSATPVIISLEDSRFQWTLQKSGDIIQATQSLHNNLEKKYKDYFKESISPTQNFIRLIEIKNQKPQKILFTKEGKRIALFGNKFRIIPNEDSTSQKLAFLALGVGLGEKNSFGGGFCLAKGV